MLSHQKEDSKCHEQIIISLVLDGLEADLMSSLQHSNVSGAGADGADKSLGEETGISSPISSSLKSRSILSDGILLQ